MKKILLCGLALLTISGGANAKDPTDQEAAENAVIMSGRMGSGWANGYTASLISIDGKGFFLSDSGELVKPGMHSVKVGASHLSYGTMEAVVQCNTLPGHLYQVNQTNCVDLGVSKAADRHFKVEADRQAQERIAADKIKYQEYKQALLSPQPPDALKEMKWSLESNQGGFKEDPDGLLAKVAQQLQPYLEAERKQQAADAAERAKQQAMKEKEAAAQAKQLALEESKRAEEEAGRRVKELQQISAFRKSLKEGDETNCGAVIESKPKIIKITFAVANYGNEHWIRREEIYPSGYGCRFVNGQYQAPQ